MRLWFRLRPMRSRGLAFRRLSEIGAYIADFECRKAKLIVEVDGAQHDQKDARTYDAQRTKWLEAQGYQVLRFWNHDVLRQTDVIVDEITRIAAERSQQPRREQPR